MMDKERRTRLRRVVGEARKLIEDEVRVQLRRLGIDGGGRAKPIEELPHLNQGDVETRKKVLNAIEKERVGRISQREAYDRYVAHIGFTYVNRLAALRTMEVRGLIKETVKRRDKYGGRSRREYEIAERQGIYDPYELLRASLLEAFNQVSAEIKVLFDINSEYSLIFPRHRALKELLGLLSEEIPGEDWKEDDIIGWIYQYYNEEARAKFKKERRKPRADDIPVINQFYTPRWVVRALVDNTLGRLWLEMTGRCPKPGDPVKRTREQLENPSGDTVDEFCTYLVPLAQDPPPREEKRVREIKVLDPACGSGHFLVYAFDVLYRMYRGDEPDTPKEEIPRLILENNLYGIDIDLRAVQLAALSLYLKAKSYNPKLNITKMNLVCADVRITDGKAQKAFLERSSDDPELQRIFAKLFEDLECTYEAGSLLKVREPFERLLKRRRGGVQAILYPRLGGQTEISKRGKIEGQAKLTFNSSREGGEEKVIAIPKVATLEQMLDALERFEEEAMEKRDMGTLLFATEAEKSVGLLALLSDKYDVVVMNPPYGSMPEATKEYLREHFPKTHHDYYAAFMEQAVNLTHPSGYIGALTGRTFMFLKSHQWVREQLLGKQAPVQVVFDLGFGVLDVATARWAAFIAHKNQSYTENGHEKVSTTFFRLTEYQEEEERRTTLEEALTAVRNGLDHKLVFKVTLEDLSQIPGTPYSYWTTANLRSLYIKHPPLDKDTAKKHEATKIARVGRGLETVDDARFTRYFWEVPSKCDKEKWKPYAKKIEYDSRFYADINMVVNWENRGKTIKEWIVKRYPYLHGKYGLLVKNENFYFREGLSWSRIASSKHLAFRKLPAGTIFSGNHCGVFISNLELLDRILAWANSALASFLIFQMNPLLHVWQAGEVAKIPLSMKVLENEALSRLAQEARDILREWDTGNEISTLFIKPWLLHVLHGFNSKEKPSTGHSFAEQFEWGDWRSLKEIRTLVGNKRMDLSELTGLVIKREKIMQAQLGEIQKRIDKEVYRLYEISEEDKKLIEKELALRRGEISTSEESEEGEIEEAEQEEKTLDVEEKTKDYVARLISFYIRKTIESDKDGIVPLHELVQGVREHLANDFGEDQADAKEKEMEEILGRSLEEWILADYFDFHVNLYKRRPIFWHLTSSNLAGGRGSEGAFNCVLHYHKLDRDTIPKIKMNYLRVELERAKWRVDRMRRELQEARDSNDKQRERRLPKEFEQAQSIFEELESFGKALEEVHNPHRDKTRLDKDARWVDKAIAEVRDNGYNPITDYGVRVNIEPFKEAGLLHRAAERVK